MFAPHPRESNLPPPLVSASLLVAGALCVLPFLLPHHAQPMPSFQAEWLAIALSVTSVTLALMGLAGRASDQAPMPGLSKALFAFAVFIAIQSVLRTPAYPSIPLLGAFYVLFAALSLWLGTQLVKTFGQARVVTLLARCVLAGALLTAMLAIIQYAGRPRWMEDFVAGLAADRAYGNIAQANLFANYIALGEASLMFLWARRTLSTPAALIAAVMLAGAGVLSGTRSTLLFALWFAAIGAWSGIRRSHPEWRRLTLAGVGMAMIILMSSTAAIWVGTFASASLPSAASLARLLDGAALTGEPRWQAWLLAWQIFPEQPLLGAGWGSFSGAAFGAGIPPEMTRYGEVWTSAHNIFLQLLAETGLVGTAIIVFGLATWWWHAGRRWLVDTSPVLGWVIAIAGIELLHSMVEFPLWSAHFLGLTALVMGTGAEGPPRPLPTAWNRFPAKAMACVVLAVGLVIALRDHFLLDTTYITGTAVTLATPDQARRDADTMHELARGLFAPIAETRIFIERPPEQLADSAVLAMSGRVIRFWPSHSVAVRRAIVLAQSGRASEAIDLIGQALLAFPRHCASMRAMLKRTRPAQPKVIDPLLEKLRQSSAAHCA